MEIIILTICEHKGADRLFAKFPYKNALINIMRKIPGATFSYTHKSWYAENNSENVKEIFRLFKDIAVIDATAVFPKNKERETKAHSPINLPDFQNPANFSKPTSTLDIQPTVSNADYESLAEMMNSDYVENILDITYKNPEPSSIIVEEKKESDYRL